MRIRSHKDVYSFVSVVTLLAASLSEASVFLLYAVRGPEAFHFEAAILFAGLVPILITVPIATYIARMSLTVNRTQVELQHLADTDSLTTLPNRRYFFRAVESVLTNNPGQVHSLLVLDADHFKDLNDTYGHAVGDLALIAIADVLRTSFRETDFVCRVGGEEFAVFLANTPTLKAEKLAQRVVDAVAAKPIATQTAVIEYSVSCGVADTEHIPDLPTLFKAADDAMYIAKRKGRNRVSTISEAA